MELAASAALGAAWGGHVSREEQKPEGMKGEAKLCTNRRTNHSSDCVASTLYHFVLISSNQPTTSRLTTSFNFKLFEGSPCVAQMEHARIEGVDIDIKDRT